MQQARPSFIEGVPGDPGAARRWADRPHDVLRALIQEAQSRWLDPMAAAWTQEEEGHTAKLAALEKKAERARSALQDGLQDELAEISGEEQQALAEIEQKRKALQDERQRLRRQLSWALGQGAD